MINPRIVDLVCPATAGSAGAAVAEISVGPAVAGHVLAVSLSITGTVLPATADITLIVQQGNGFPDITILSIPDAATVSGTYYPRIQQQDINGAVLEETDAGGYEQILVYGTLKLTVAGADAATIVRARVYLG